MILLNKSEPFLSLPTDLLLFLDFIEYKIFNSLT
jgi:hypothetical protein